MKEICSESLSDDYLHINNCGCQRLYGCDSGSIRPNGRIDYHILYIAKGTCFVTLNKKITEAPAGSVVVYLPHQRQEYKFYKDIKSKSYYVHFSGSACNELLEKFGMTHKNIFFIGKSLTIENLYDALIDEFHLKLDYYEYHCQSLLLNILSVIARKISDAEYDKSDIKNQLNEICKHIYANYDKNISINDYAKMCNLSESRFSHIFKEIMGVSPKNYILSAKIEISKELLRNTGLSISQISEKTGFQNQNYFSRIFKKYTHTSPSEYRFLENNK